jgi:hypothetical protein
MAEWEWEKGRVLKGTGKVVKKGFAIVKFSYIDELRFKIKGKLSKDSKGSETAKDILYFELGVEDIGIRHLPVSFVEIILNSLWEINIDSLKSANMNGTGLKKKNVLLDMGKRIKDGKQEGDIEFVSPVSKRDVDKFTRNLAELLPLFRKDEKKRRDKDKEDESPPMEYGGPGQEPVKWYAVHGRGNF